jgi:hypothetical protein
MNICNGQIRDVTFENNCIQILTSDTLYCFK